MLEKATLMLVTFLILWFPQHTGQLVFDSGEKGIKWESNIVVMSCDLVIPDRHGASDAP